MVELAFKVYAFQLEFFHHKFEVLDGIVVIVSFILDIVYISQENAFDGVGLLILLRLWRVARIINGTLHISVIHMKLILTQIMYGDTVPPSTVTHCARLSCLDGVELRLQQNTNWTWQIPALY